MPERVLATNGTIRDLVLDAIGKYGPDCDLNFIDVSQVTDMSWLFNSSPFTGNISGWNVGNVANMYAMFEGCPLEREHRLPQWYKDRMK